MAHLLYLLNPQVDITLGRLALVTIVYGLICGFLFGSILWGLRVLRVRLFGRPDEEGTYRTHGFGFVVLAAFIASATYWIHLYVVRIYLPIGAVRILAKATNAITLTAFCLLVLWVLERNAKLRFSRIIFFAGVLLVAASSVFLYQRREGYRDVDRSAVVANIGTVAGQRPVILIAIRNLPYDWILTLAGEDRLPFLDRAKDSANFARLEPFPTTSPKALWASLATGKLPYGHGVTGRFSYRTPLNGSNPDERFLLLPSGVGFQAWGLIPPVQRISAPLPAGDALPLWTMFERLGLRAAVINWPSSIASGASHIVTDRAVRAGKDVPAEAAQVTQRFNGTGPARQRILEGLSADWRAAQELRRTVDRNRFELNVLALEGFSEAQRALRIFRNDLPSRSTPTGEALRAYAEQLDRIVGGLARDYPDHLLVVVSPSAVVPPQLPASAYSLAVRALRDDDPGADDGFVMIAGPGTTHRPNAPAAFVVDIVPTVLFAAGLPVGRDMDGRILSSAFSEEFLRQTTLAVIQTYEARQLIVRRSGGA